MFVSVEDSDDVAAFADYKVDASAAPSAPTPAPPAPVAAAPVPASVAPAPIAVVAAPPAPTPTPVVTTPEPVVATLAVVETASATIAAPVGTYVPKWSGNTVSTGVLSKMLSASQTAYIEKYGRSSYKPISV